MTNYFKSEGAMYEFLLLNLTGKERNRLLKVRVDYYSKNNRDMAEAWYNNIREQIEDEKAIKELDKLFKMIAG